MGLLTFLGVCYAMRSRVPVGHFRNISGHLFTWLVCGSFQWRHGLLFTDCIVWDDKDKVVYLGWWSTSSPKLQLFQLSQHSHVISCRLISSSAYFPWNSHDVTLCGWLGLKHQLTNWLTNLQVAAFCILKPYFMKRKLKKMSIDGWWRVNAVITETFEALETRYSIIPSGSNLIF